MGEEEKKMDPFSNKRNEDIKNEANTPEGGEWGTEEGRMGRVPLGENVQVFAKLKAE